MTTTHKNSVICLKLECSGVNQARKHLFATLGKHIGAIPPTLAVLFQHILRAAYQAGHIWGRATGEFELEPPSPSGWGWKMEKGCVDPSVEYWSRRSMVSLQGTQYVRLREWVCHKAVQLSKAWSAVHSSVQQVQG